MAIKIHCRVCGAYIKDVPFDKISTITGKELCVICDERIKEIYTETEKFKRDTIIKVNAVWNVAREELKQVEGFRKKMLRRCEVIFNKKAANVDDLIKNVLKERRFYGKKNN